MSKRPVEIPDRVFTVYETPVRDNACHYSRSGSDWVGLIFVDRGRILTVNDLAEVMVDPQLRTLLGDFYAGGPFSWTRRRYGWSAQTTSPGDEHGLVVSQRFVHLPDGQSHPNAPFFVMSEGTLHRFIAHDVYRGCRDLYRLMGCHKCPSQGAACVQRHLQIPLKQPPLPAVGESTHVNLADQRDQLTWADAQEEFREGYTIAGFSYISPILAHDTPTQPGASTSYLPTLSFKRLDDAREALSARTLAGVKTRRTKRVECTKCYFGGYGYKKTPSPCDKWRPRNCEHGAWTEAQLLEATIPPFEARLKEDGYTLRQFEQLLAITGKEIKLPLGEDGRLVKGVVSRLVFSRPEGRTQVGLCRTGIKNRGVLDQRTLDDVLSMLPDDLRRIFDEAPTLSPMTLATAIHATVCNSVKPYVCMAGCCRSVAPHISHVAVHHEWQGVEVGYWTTTYWREFHFKDLEALQQYYGNLTAFTIARDAGDVDFRYSVWPR